MNQNTKSPAILIIFLLVLGTLYYPDCQAAKVSKIKQNKVLISLDGASLKTGDTLENIDSSGNQIAILKVLKVKGTKAKASIIKGSPEVGSQIKVLTKSSEIDDNASDNSVEKEAPTENTDSAFRGIQVGVGVVSNTSFTSLPILYRIDYGMSFWKPFLQLHLGASFWTQSEEFKKNQESIENTISNVGAALGYVFRPHQNFHIEPGLEVGYAILKFKTQSTVSSNFKNDDESLASLSPYMSMKYLASSNWSMGARVSKPVILDTNTDVDVVYADLFIQRHF